MAHAWFLNTVGISWPLGGKKTINILFNHFNRLYLLRNPFIPSDSISV